jgi:hypothetical protein
VNGRSLREISEPALAAQMGFAVSLRDHGRVVCKRFDEKIHDGAPEFPHRKPISDSCDNITSSRNPRFQLCRKAVVWNPKARYAVVALPEG